MSDSFSSSRAADGGVGPTSARGILSLVGSVFLGGLLLVAAYAKTLDPEAFARQIQTEGLDFVLPAMVVALIALAIEYFLGTALLLGIRHRAILWPTAALVIFFLFLTGRTYWRFTQGIEPDDASCGCFGNLVQRTPAEAFWQDLFLMVPPLMLAFLGLRGGGLPKVRTAIATVLTLAATAFAWAAPDLPIDDFATRLRPGAQVADLCVAGAEGEEPICMDFLVPELLEGDHLVTLTELGEDELESVIVPRIEALNEYYWSEDGSETPLWVLSSATEEDLFRFRFEYAPTFEIREIPPPLLRLLLRRAPRSFAVRDGVVTETYPDLPPALREP